MKRVIFLGFVVLVFAGTFHCFEKASEVFCPGVGATTLTSGQQCPPVDGGTSDAGKTDAGVDSGADAGQDAGDGG
ncbi:MAG: hypothetical protein HYY84_11400 [Deltaproteobacteria bacterium]|nr:hypothetical protein [Deltaproteobacteria bacterium]